MKFALKSEIIWNTMRKEKRLNFRWGKDFGLFCIIQRLVIHIFRIWLIRTGPIFHALADHRSIPKYGQWKRDLIWFLNMALISWQGLALYLHASCWGKKLCGRLILESLLSLVRSLVRASLFLILPFNKYSLCSHLAQSGTCWGIQRCTWRGPCPQKEAIQVVIHRDQSTEMFSRCSS